MQRKTGIWAICFCLASLTGTANAQPDTTAASQLRITAVGDTSHGLATTINLDADDAFLPSVLTTLSELSGYNIVTGPEVNRQERISIHLHDTPIEEAINLVVRAAGLSYEIVGNSFLVTRHENLEQEVGVSSYLVELQYAKAAEMKALLQDLTENIQVDSSHNALLITTGPKIISEIRNTIQRLDVPSKQIVLRTRVIEVQVDKIKELGIDWERLSELSAIFAERPYDPKTGPRSLEWTEIDQNAGEPPRTRVLQKIEGLKNVGIFDRQLLAFELTLDFLLQSNRAKLLTDTKLATLNNRPASIHIGEIIPFVVRSTESARVEREQTGIQISILPQVNDDGYITATIKPEASTIVELINGEIPRKKVRTAETTVLVKDRQKIVIAGLLNTETAADVHTVPFFGDLPFFGNIFKHYETKDVTTDLIIEITPYVLDNIEPHAQMLRDSLVQSETPIERFDREQKRASQKGVDTMSIGPTHLALMPTPATLSPLHYVVSVHELSLGSTNNIQLTFSPWQTIGRLWFGLKYGPIPGLAVGFGYHQGNYIDEEKYDLGPRFGMYGVKSLIDEKFIQLYLSIDTQLGKYNSYGGSIGLGVHLGKLVTIMAEASESYTPETPEDREYWDPWATGAIRLRAPWDPHLSFDAGVSMHSDGYFDKPFSVDYQTDYVPTVYFDIAYTGVFRETGK